MLLSLCFSSIPFDSCQKWCQIEFTHLMLRCFGSINFKVFNGPHEFIHGFESEFSKDFPYVLCNEMHEVHDMFRFTCEQLSKVTVLCGDSDWTCIFMTHSHHDASEYDERCRCKCEFLCTQCTGNRNITSGHQLTVCFK